MYEVIQVDDLGFFECIFVKMKDTDEGPAHLMFALLDALPIWSQLLANERLQFLVFDSPHLEEYCFLSSSRIH